MVEIAGTCWTVLGNGGNFYCRGLLGSAGKHWGLFGNSREVFRTLLNFLGSVASSVRGVGNSW